ncbi:DNRLRE domain-containing protein [Streptomyces sp. NPDC101133]|uniref:DNRLRE domain-containing protein n=1 Tax=Streptomyces sp. NPDC101133 TaxID=3366111 RepID=UPI00380EE91C
MSLHRQQEPRRRRRARFATGVALLLVAETALVAGASLPAGAAPAAEPDGPKAVQPSKEDILESDIAWAARHAKGSKAWAVTQAEKTGKKVVVTDETTATTYTVANPDGTLTTELTTGPERVWRDGEWRKVDVTLTAGADGAVRAKNHPDGLRLAGRTGKAPTSLRAAQKTAPKDLVTLGSGEQAVTLQWKGGLPKPELDGTTARYNEAVPGADVIVEATRTGFEQYVEIAEKPTTDGYSYTLPVKAKGLVAKANKDGSVAFTDARTGVVRATMPTPVMWDASVDQRSGKHENRARVGMKVVNKGHGVVDLVITPDADFLADPATQYPVTVDPSTSALGNLFDTYVQRGETVDWSGDTELDLGNPGTKNADGTYRTARSFITWNTAPIADALVSKATLSLWNFHSGNTDCTAQPWEVWTASNASTSSRWTNQPVMDAKYATSTATRGNPGCTTADGWITADVTTLAQYWAGRKWDHAGMGLRTSSESDIHEWKRVNSANNAANQPKLTVTYNYRPSDGTNRQAGAPFKSYAGVWAVNTTTPTLRDTFTDQDGDQVNGTFQVYDAATNTPITTPLGEGLLLSPYGDQGKPVSVTVPAGQLKDGRTYKFRTNAYDGTHYNLNWSPWTQFVVDTTAPDAPAMSSTTYPEGQWGGGTDIPGQFSVETGDDGAREVRFRLDGIADLPDEEALDDPETSLRAPTLLAETWQSTPTDNTSSAAFAITPTATGSHYVEAATVDRADNVGAVRAYGFRAGTGPRRTNHVVDITLPKPKKSDGTWQQVEEYQSIPEWSPDFTVLDVARTTGSRTAPDAAASDAAKEQCRESGTTRICSTVELREVHKPGAKAPEAGRAPSGGTRAEATPAPIIPHCSAQGQYADGTFTRTQACLGYRYTYRAFEISSNKPPQLKGVAVFNIEAQVLTDVKSNDIKFWMRWTPQPLLPTEPPVKGTIKVKFDPTCDFGCTGDPDPDWDGPMTWNGSYATDPHQQTGTAVMTWDTALDDLGNKGPHDQDRQRSFPIEFYMEIDTNLDGVKKEAVKFENGTFAARCDAANIYNMPTGCVFPTFNPGWVIDPATYPAAAVHATLMSSKLPGSEGHDYANPLHYLPMTKKGKPQRNRFDRHDQANRRVVCGRSGTTGFVPHDKTALFDYLLTPKPNKPNPKDTPSCDEYALNATYESGGMPQAPDGSANPYLVNNGEECVQTYAGLSPDGTLHLRDDGRYPEPDWSKVKCGRSSMSLEINSGAMRLFSRFAAANRLLDADGYYVWTGLNAAGCNWLAEKVICDNWANGFPDRGDAAVKLSAPRR